MSSTCTTTSAPCAREHAQVRSISTAKERDLETGLDSFGARYMSSATGRWTSPDLLNLTEDRLLNPTNTLNKYVYGANNPLKYIDRDGKDITVFFESPSLIPPSAGHILFTAENQQTGDAAVMSFGPIRSGFGDAERTFAGLPMVGTRSFGLDNATADDLRKTYSSLTIETSPEEAQQVIDFIRQHPDVGDSYMLYQSNCTTVCVEALKVINKLTQNNKDWTPSGLWKTIFTKYAHPHWQNNLGWTASRPGVDYGRPNLGYDSFQLLELLSKHCTDSWNDKTNTLTSTCN